MGWCDEKEKNDRRDHSDPFGDRNGRHDSRRLFNGVIKDNNFADVNILGRIGMSKRKKAGIAAGILAVICIGVFVYISQTVKGATKDNKIVRGVIFEGKSLAGMTKEEAKKQSEDYI